MGRTSDGAYDCKYRTELCEVEKMSRESNPEFYKNKAPTCDKKFEEWHKNECRLEEEADKKADDAFLEKHWKDALTFLRDGIGRRKMKSQLGNIVREDLSESKKDMLKYPIHHIANFFKGDDALLDALIAELLARKYVTTRKNKDGNTPLDLTISREFRFQEEEVTRVQIIKKLIELGGDPNHEIWSKLSFSRLSSPTFVVSELLAAGISREGLTMHMFVLFEDEEELQSMLAYMNMYRPDDRDTPYVAGNNFAEWKANSIILGRDTILATLSRFRRRLGPKSSDAEHARQRLESDSRFIPLNIGIGTDFSVNLQTLENLREMIKLSKRQDTDVDMFADDFPFPRDRRDYFMSAYILNHSFEIPLIVRPIVEYEDNGEKKGMYRIIWDLKALDTQPLHEYWTPWYGTVRIWDANTGALL